VKWAFELLHASCSPPCSMVCGQAVAVRQAALVAPGRFLCWSCSWAFVEVFLDWPQPLWGEVGGEGLSESCSHLGVPWMFVSCQFAVSWYRCCCSRFWRFGQP
jgi:hypothetical protein